MSERRLTNQWEPWQRLIDSIGPHYRTQPAGRVRSEPRDLDEEQLEGDRRGGRAVASIPSHRLRRELVLLFPLDCESSPRWYSILQLGDRSTSRRRDRYDHTSCEAGGCGPHV